MLPAKELGHGTRDEPVSGAEQSPMDADTSLGTADQLPLAVQRGEQTFVAINSVYPWNDINLAEFAGAKVEFPHEPQFFLQR